MDINPNGCMRQLVYLLFATLLRLYLVYEKKGFKGNLSEQRFIAKQREIFELLIKFPFQKFLFSFALKPINKLRWSKLNFPWKLQVT